MYGPSIWYAIEEGRFGKVPRQPSSALSFQAFRLPSHRALQETPGQDWIKLAAASRAIHEKGRFLKHVENPKESSINPPHLVCSLSGPRKIPRDNQTDASSGSSRNYCLRKCQSGLSCEGKTIKERWSPARMLTVCHCVWLPAWCWVECGELLSLLMSKWEHRAIFPQPSKRVTFRCFSPSIFPFLNVLFVLSSHLPQSAPQPPFQQQCRTPSVALKLRSQKTLQMTIIGDAVSHIFTQTWSSSNTIDIQISLQCRRHGHILLPCRASLSAPSSFYSLPLAALKLQIRCRQTSRRWVGYYSSVFPSAFLLPQQLGPSTVFRVASLTRPYYSRPHLEGSRWRWYAPGDIWNDDKWCAAVGSGFAALPRSDTWRYGRGSLGVMLIPRSPCGRDHSGSWNLNCARSVHWDVLDSGVGHHDFDAGSRKNQSDFHRSSRHRIGFICCWADGSSHPWH